MPNHGGPTEGKGQSGQTQGRRTEVPVHTFLKNLSGSIVHLVSGSPVKNIIV